mmetsp:Transcript_44013/g.39241  ORF Transcript_44013/g.39241 Transcript_44013/m.39241 type:complete len:772 (+) Transcript_44013:24-2339(+)
MGGEESQEAVAKVQQHNVANGPINKTATQPKPQQVESKQDPSAKPKSNPSQTESKSQPPTNDQSPVNTKQATKSATATAPASAKSASSEEKTNPYIDEKLSKAQQQYTPQKNQQFENKHAVQTDKDKDQKSVPKSQSKPKSVSQAQPTSSTVTQPNKQNVASTKPKQATNATSSPSTAKPTPKPKPKSNPVAGQPKTAQAQAQPQSAKKVAPKVLKKPPPKQPKSPAATQPKPKPKAKVKTKSTLSEPITSNYVPEKPSQDIKAKIEEYFHTSYPINITEDVFNTKNDLIRLRRYFHANPELSWQEIETAKNISNYCESLGLATKQGVGKTGVVAVLHGAFSDGDTIGLRADMDALPINEENINLPFKSRKKNVSHACGHDCHMAILLTVARILSQPKYVKKLHGCVKFIFQPAEEGGAGAKFMIEDGVLEEDDELSCAVVDQIYGLHVWSYNKLGKIVVKPGALMAGSTKFSIKVKGVGGHGAEPKGTSDTVLALTQLSIQLHSIVSRNLSPIDCGVLTIGTMNVGDAANIIAETGNITGTVRFLDNEIYELIKKRVREICEGIETSYNVEININWGQNPYPPVINHDRNTKYVKQAVTKVFPMDENVLIEDLTTMAAEDFSFYLNEKPGCFFFLGCGVDEFEGDDEKDNDPTSTLKDLPPKIMKNIEDGDEKVTKIYAHHTPNFRVDERCLIVGVQIMVNLVMDLLMKPKVIEKEKEDNTDKNDVDLDDEDEEQLTQIEDYKKSGNNGTTKPKSKPILVPISSTITITS